MSATQPITAVMIGAGDRGKDVYGRYALEHPGEIRFVAVAEPAPSRREAFARQHQIPSSQSYSTWERLLERDRMGDAAFICTQDRLHTRPALAALDRGYHVMLEKPMAPTAAECNKLVETAEERSLHLQIAHVLRYTPFFHAVYHAIESGQLGQVICLSQRENVSYWHMAHAYVRGNWRNRQLSSPMILTKCCHDMDLLHWLVGARAGKISSFGSLAHYRPENVPSGAPDRCTDGCPHEPSCQFSAIDLYVRLTPLIRVAQMADSRSMRMLGKFLERHPRPIERLARVLPPLRQFTEYSGWPVRVVTDDYDRAGRLRAIQDPANPYGRCVYHCDNDVVDHQHVGVEFEGGVTATLIMHGHSYAEGRTLRIDGSEATLVGEMYLHRQRLELFEKRTGRKKVIFSRHLNLDDPGHGGGDAGLVKAFVDLIRDDREAEGSTDARGALESHLMAFAAEKSRMEGRVIPLEEIR